MDQTTFIHSKAQLFEALGQSPDLGPRKGVFELALALAGTVSSGAYTAGVLDFLQLALDAWEEARARGEEVPRHRVLLMGISGASGGSIAGALFAAGLAKAPTAPTALHQAWVDLIGFEGLLRVPAALETPLLSFLDSAVLDELGQTVLAWMDAAPTTAWRPWAADPLTLRFTLGNLSGLPYWLPMEGAASTGSGYGMVLHGDYAGFGVSPDSTSPRPGDFPLAALGTVGGTRQAWTEAVTSALASGAFPMAFRSRVQAFPVALRNARPFVSPLDPDRFVVIPPALPREYGAEYRSYNCDGGMLNNEPIDLAREILAGPGGANERKPGLAQRLVVMVGPLVHTSAWSSPSIEAVWQEMLPLVGAWKEQARFKTSDLVLAALGDVASRWLIAPKSPAPDPADPFLPPTPIISAGLGAFGGFLHLDFRQHDYDLGRHNCQAFLKQWFRLPASNPGFDLKGVAGELPVIPLVGVAAMPVPPPAYPRPGTFTARDQVAFQGDLGRRLDYVKERLEASLKPAWCQRAAIWAAWRLWGRDRLLRSMGRSVQGFLRAYRL